MTDRSASAWAAALFTLVAVGPACAMDVATFLAKGEAVQKKGPLAVLSPDGPVLMAELQSSIKALRAERAAAQAAGQRPAYCPPPNQTPMQPDEIFASLKAIPEAERAHMEVKDALRGVYARRYPCPA